MFAEYIQRHINDARCQFYAALHNTKCEAVQEQTSLLGRKNKYKNNLLYLFII